MTADTRRARRAKGRAAGISVGKQFIFGAVTKTAMIIRFATAIAVPGRFNTYGEAHAACLRVFERAVPMLIPVCQQKAAQSRYGS